MLDIAANLPYIWLAAAVIFLIIEGMTVGLTIIWFAAGALAAFLLALLHLPPWSQIAAFIIVSGATLWFVRPLVSRFVIKKTVTTNFDMIIGKQGIVEVEIDNSAPTGLIKVIGQSWTARSLYGDVIAAGEKVEVVSIEGVKAFVRPVPDRLYAESLDMAGASGRNPK